MMRKYLGVHLMAIRLQTLLILARPTLTVRSLLIADIINAGCQCKDGSYPPVRNNYVQDGHEHVCQRSIAASALNTTPYCTEKEQFVHYTQNTFLSVWPFMRRYVSYDAAR
eukprot:13957-Heterococcus_DN1.PRE.2